AAAAPASRCNLALVTAACYPPARLKHEARWLFASAARVGWLVHAFGVGTAFDTMYRTKIERLAAWIRSLPRCYDSVLYVDARDVLVLDSQDHVASKIYHGVVIGMESNPWPETGEAWASALRRETFLHEARSALAYINAGMF